MYQRIIHASEVKPVELDFPGVSIQVLEENQSTGALILLTTLAAGAVIPEHWHSHADESVYVMTGDFVEAGVAYGPGSFFVGKSGTSHGPHQSMQGCTVLSYFSATLDFQLGSTEA